MTEDRLLSLVESALTTTEALIADVGDDQWTAPSPCEDMDALALARHMVGSLTQFADVGTGVQAGDAVIEPSFAAGAARHEYDLAGDRMLSVWAEPGVATRTYPMPWGETPGIALLGFTLIEQVTHGWDIAVATGQSPPYEDDVAEAALRLAHQYDDPSIRVPGMFAPALPIEEDAPAIDRLAAFLGRDVTAWGRG